MNIDIECPGCGARFAVQRELIGKRARCTRCGAPFLIPELPQSPPQPAPTDTPSWSEQPITPEPLPQSQPARGAAGRAKRFVGRIFGFESNQSQPRFPALRMVARSYEILAVLILAIAAVLLLLLVIHCIKLIADTHDLLEIIPYLLGSGMGVVWAFATALMLLFISQVIRLGLQIEQNTRETQAACRQLADHLCAIEVEG
jgi:predicted Zn finger-like uncharacterized protein